MRKRIFFCYFIVCLIALPVFAEVGAGYYFRFNNFKLSIDFNEYALDRYLQEDEKYIDASKCFYSILQTLYFYRQNSSSFSSLINSITLLRRLRLIQTLPLVYKQFFVRLRNATYPCQNYF